MAIYFELTGDAYEAYRQMVEELRSRARSQLKVSDESLVTRPLRPEDVGLTTPKWEFNISSADAWNTLIDNKTIADNRFVGINGVLYGMSAQGAVTMLRVKRAGDIVRYWPIQDLNYLENATAFFDDPVMVDQNQPITLEGYATKTSSTERIVLLGAVVEKRGILVK